jgi:hypothetical protein
MGAGCNERERYAASESDMQRARAICSEWERGDATTEGRTLQMREGAHVTTNHLLGNRAPFVLTTLLLTWSLEFLSYARTRPHIHASHSLLSAAIRCYRNYGKPYVLLLYVRHKLTLPYRKL